MGWLESPMTLVWLVYFSLAELLSLLPSQPSSCILISEEASAENYSGDYACASMHEAIFRFIRYILDHADHDNIIAFGTMMIAVFTYVLYRSTEKLWIANENQLAHARSEAEVTDLHRTAQFEQIAEQVEALKQSADAAERSVEETRRL